MEQNKFYDQLLMIQAFDKDPRVKFVGTVDDQELPEAHPRMPCLPAAMKLEEPIHRFKAFCITKLNLLPDVILTVKLVNTVSFIEKDELAHVIEEVKQFDEGVISN